MNNIIIVGNSGAARECYSFVKACEAASELFRFNYLFKGFLSYQYYPGSLGKMMHLSLGDLSEYSMQPHDRFVIGVGDPQLRREIFQTIKQSGGEFINLISPRCFIEEDCLLGEGNIFAPGCGVSVGITIGDGNYFNGNILLGHDVTIGDFNFFAPGTTMLGNVSVGDRNMIAVHSTLLPNASIGNCNHIHPGSILYKGCKNNCRMAGNPALKIGEI